MIKLRIVDDEFKNYSEDFSVGEFQATDAIEYFSTSETGYCVYNRIMGKASLIFGGIKFWKVLLP